GLGPVLLVADDDRLRRRAREAEFLRDAPEGLEHLDDFFRRRRVRQPDRGRLRMPVAYRYPVAVRREHEFGIHEALAGFEPAEDLAGFLGHLLFFRADEW